MYLDDDLWNLLHAVARRQGETVSELVRSAVREKYGPNRGSRKKAFEEVIGLWKGREDVPDAYVRVLRRGRRLEENAQ